MTRAIFLPVWLETLIAGDVLLLYGVLLDGDLLLLQAVIMENSASENRTRQNWECFIVVPRFVGAILYGCPKLKLFIHLITIL